jgi:hypothetical protein
MNRSAGLTLKSSSTTFYEGKLSINTAIEFTFTSSSECVDWILAVTDIPTWYLWTWDGNVLTALDIISSSTSTTTELCFDASASMAYIAYSSIPQEVISFKVTNRTVAASNTITLSTDGKNL